MARLDRLSDPNERAVDGAVFSLSFASSSNNIAKHVYVTLLS